MVLISLVCSNLATKISKIFETCKLFWPASEDFVNSATVFVNSATPRGRGPRSPRLSFSLAQRKELKETFPQPRPSPEGRMQPLLLVALYTKVRLGIIALAWLFLMGPCPIPQNTLLPPHGVCGGSINERDMKPMLSKFYFLLLSIQFSILKPGFNGS